MSDLVVKDNRLINSTYYLDLVEQRIVLLSIILAREKGEQVSSDEVFKFHISDYSSAFNVEASTAYISLQSAVQSLRTRYVSYKTKDQETGKEVVFECNWVSQVGYSEGSSTVYVQFTSHVIPLISRLDKNFTSYQLARVANLRSKYSIRLYEVLIAWKKVKKTPVIDYWDLRNRLGVGEGEYSKMSNFKTRILDFAIDEINEHTDIIVSYEQHKTGRSVTGFTFTFDFKKDAIEGESKEVKPLKKLTDKQIFMFSMKLAELQEFQNVFESKSGESYSDFAERIAEKLTEAENVQKWAKYLEQVGFKC